MNNPFLGISASSLSQFQKPVCSLNSVVIAKVPVKGIEDDIQGKRALDFFSTPLLVQDIKDQAKKNKISVSHYKDNNLPLIFEKGLMSDNIRLKMMCQELAIKYGNRLGLILLTLKTGLQQNREARPDWDDEHWQYWKDIKTVILVGGLASGNLGKRFKECIYAVFDYAGVEPYNILLFESGTHVGTMGCAELISQENIRTLVFDFGQTNLKRAIVRKLGRDISEIKFLPTLPSINMELHIKDKDIENQKAFELHKYLINTIADTFKEVNEVHDVSNEIIISIASYTKDGVLNDKRGGYAKLVNLGSNYAKILSDELSGRLHKPVNVKMIHDGTAVALYFKDYEKSVCITLGTAIGVGFPDIKI